MIPDEELTTLRRDMLRFTQLQLRDAALSEDLVQDATMAAFEKVENFEGRASMRTWVFTILRHRIIDHLRRQKIKPDTESLDSTVNALFDDAEHWREETTPADWGNPVEALESQQFWAIFEACLTRLQESAARVFMLREMMGFETNEISTTIGITSNHCGVLLHRARLALRACLEHQWVHSGR